MQKSVLWVVFFLLIPAAEAALSLEGPANTLYNLGDQITLNGFITPSQDQLGLFKIDLRCQGDTQLFAKLMRLKKDQRVSFSETLPLPFYVEGDCTFHATFTAGNTIIEEATSRTFQMSKELKGTFSWDKTQAQLGETVTLQGDVYHLDGTGVSGTASLFFKQGETSYAADTALIEDGHFVYHWNTEAYPPGTYAATIDAHDVLGNVQTFTTESVTLLGDLVLEITADALHVLPGEELAFEGKVTTRSGAPVETGTVSWTFADIAYESSIKKGFFRYTIEIPPSFPTGEVTLALTAVDLFGNAGSASLSFVVDAVPTDLIFIVPEGEFKPEEVFSVEAKVVDQAGALVAEDITLDISNPNGKRIFQEVLASGIAKELTLPVFALPGDWKLKVMSKDFSVTKNLYVKEVKELAYFLEGDVLTIHNIGNVPYHEPVKVALQGFDRPVNTVQQVDLAVDERMTVNLGEGIITGAYSVAVGDQVFEDVQVEGFEKKDYSWVYYLILGVLIFSLVYFFMLRDSRSSSRARKPDEDPSFDINLQKRVQRDVEQHTLQQRSQQMGRKYVGDTPVLGKENTHGLDSHGSETLWSRKREQTKRSDTQSKFGGMFD